MENSQSRVMIVVCMYALILLQKSCRYCRLSRVFDRKNSYAKSALLKNFRFSFFTLSCQRVVMITWVVFINIMMRRDGFDTYSTTFYLMLNPLFNPENKKSSQPVLNFSEL